MMAKPIRKTNKKTMNLMVEINQELDIEHLKNLELNYSI